jgi:hypothetical protein
MNTNVLEGSREIGYFFIYFLFIFFLGILRVLGFSSYFLFFFFFYLVNFQIGRLQEFILKKHLF